MSNWNIIQKFIKKFEIEIKDFDIKIIVNGDKNKLLEFIIQMYETLTRKKLYFFIKNYNSSFKKSFLNKLIQS